MQSKETTKLEEWGKITASFTKSYWIFLAQQTSPSLFRGIWGLHCLFPCDNLHIHSTVHPHLWSQPEFWQHWTFCTDLHVYMCNCLLTTPLVVTAARYHHLSLDSQCLKLALMLAAGQNSPVCQMRLQSLAYLYFKKEKVAQQKLQQKAMKKPHFYQWCQGTGLGVFLFCGLGLVCLLQNYLTPNYFPNLIQKLSKVRNKFWNLKWNTW